MKKMIYAGFATFFVVFFIASIDAEARGRSGSMRVGGYSSHGKGSHYIGGR